MTDSFSRGNNFEMECWRDKQFYIHETMLLFAANIMKCWVYPFKFRLYIYAHMQYMYSLALHSSSGVIYSR